MIYKYGIDRNFHSNRGPLYQHRTALTAIHDPVYIYNAKR